MLVLEPAPEPRSRLASDSRPLPGAAPPSEGVPGAPVFSGCWRDLQPYSGGHARARARGRRPRRPGRGLRNRRARSPHRRHRQNSRASTRSDVLGHPLCLVGLRFGVRQRLPAGPTDWSARPQTGAPPGRPARHYTPPLPRRLTLCPCHSAWGLRPSAARFFEQQGQGALRAAPTLSSSWRTAQVRGTSVMSPTCFARHQSQRALTVRCALRHNTAHPRVPARDIPRWQPASPCFITRVAVPHAQREWQSAITADPETQQHLFEIIAPILGCAHRAGRGGDRDRQRLGRLGQSARVASS